MLELDLTVIHILFLEKFRLEEDCDRNIQGRVACECQLKPSFVHIYIAVLLSKGLIQSESDFVNHFCCGHVFEINEHCPSVSGFLAISSSSVQDFMPVTEDERKFDQVVGIGSHLVFHSELCQLLSVFLRYSSLDIFL